MSTQAIADLERIFDRLLHWYEPKFAKVWLATPHPQLQYAKPVDLIHAGRAMEVDALLDRIDSGVYS